MSYNTELQANNATLESLYDTLTDVLSDCNAALTEIGREVTAATLYDIAPLIHSEVTTSPTLIKTGGDLNANNEAMQSVFDSLDAILTACNTALVAAGSEETANTLTEVAPLIVALPPAAAVVSVYGALSETVTLTHEDGTVYTATTDANGKSTATLELPMGVYTVVGSVSKGAITSRTVTVDADTSVVTAYPDGAVFWYGNGDSADDTLYSKCGGWTPLSGAYPTGYGYTGGGNTGFAYGNASGTTGWYTWASQRSSSTQYGATSYIKNKMDYTGYTNLKVVCSSSVSSAANVVGTCASVPSGAWSAQVGLSIGATSTSVKTLTLSGTSGYFAAAAFGARYVKPYGYSVYYAYYANNTVFAVWLE